MKKFSLHEYKKMADAIRCLSADAVQAAKSGHPGMPLGMADVAVVLYAEFLRFYALDAQWFNRDRLVLSAGHGSMLLYSLLYLTGYQGFALEDLKNFRQLNSVTSGHPERNVALGIETTTGPLGQGLANAVGMAIAERKTAESFSFVGHNTYVIAGDGCLMEGISHEAASLAGHLRLGRLIVLFDNNNISIDGSTDLTTSDDVIARFASYGWHVVSVDGHNYEEIGKALSEAKSNPRPSLISCKTIIAKGSPNKEGSEKSHGAPLGADEVLLMRRNIGWEYAEPFRIGDEILQNWRLIGLYMRETYQRDMDILQNTVEGKKLIEFINGEPKFSSDYADAVAIWKKLVHDEAPTEATRQSSGRFIEHCGKKIIGLIGGSADLSGSNCTATSDSVAITAHSFAGSYIHYGIREHAMAAVMNGLAAYGGYVPYGGTFMVFSDYCRPVFRLSAMMGLRVIYIMTHDSIGLGEDGPTHQPIEHLMSLRLIPDLYVLRPADAVETLESWDIALRYHGGPSVIVLSRQSLPFIRTEFIESNLSVRGFYVLKTFGNEQKTRVRFFASGSEVSVALEAAERLYKDHGVTSTIISCPCFELFAKQNESYQAEIIDFDALNVVIEAGVSSGWHQYTGNHSLFITIESYGLSAPASDLFADFGITSYNVVDRVLDALDE